MMVCTKNTYNCRVQLPNMTCKLHSKIFNKPDFRANKPDLKTELMDVY